MIDYILDNMIVNLRDTHTAARKLRDQNVLAYTICEEIAHEQRLAPEEYREDIKNESRPLDDITDFELLTSIANEMVDFGVLDLDEGGGDVMIAYEATAEAPPNLFITERIVVSDDLGVQGYCARHDKKFINSKAYRDVIESDGVATGS